MTETNDFINDKLLRHVFKGVADFIPSEAAARELLANFQDAQWTADVEAITRVNLSHARAHFPLN